MPMVNGKKFAYTAKGKKMAKAEEKKMAKKMPVPSAKKLKKTKTGGRKKGMR
jgi:hypothetical protein